MTQNKNKKRKKITFQVASEKFLLTRNDIFICEDGFVGWKKKSKFFDKIVNDYFYSIPYRVYVDKTVHPKRRQEKRKNTNLKKYGNACSLHGNTEMAEIVKAKVINTNIKKYGVEHPLQSEEIREKVRKTNLDRWGVENPSQVEEIKNKKKQTTLKRYGVEHQMHSEKVKNKIKKTCLQKYGVEHPSQNAEIKQKKRKTFIEKYKTESPFGLPGVREKRDATMMSMYGTKNSWLNITKIIAESGQPLIEWYKEKSGTKPPYGWLSTFFKEVIDIPLEDALSSFKLFEERKTHLERTAECLFETKHYNKKPTQIVKTYRPDFKLSNNVFVNVDGLYWHSENHKNNKYHFLLREEFEKNGCRILQFREDEVYQKQDIIKSIVDNALVKTKNKIGARKTISKTVSSKSVTKFLNENHLMGSTCAKHIGLFGNDGNLVMVLSYRQRKNVCKIERLCSKKGYVVVGGFSKLLKHLERQCINPDVTEIHNWVDLRYGTGNHLLSKGFIKERETLGWKWTDGKNTFNRLRCRANMDDRGLTQKDHAEELGWYKIYDAGQRLYVKILI